MIPRPSREFSFVDHKFLTGDIINYFDSFGVVVNFFKENDYFIYTVFFPEEELYLEINEDKLEEKAEKTGEDRFYESYKYRDLDEYN
ncbi:MAG: hypothetical protein ACOC1O_05185 [bacterium]